MATAQARASGLFNEAPFIPRDPATGMPVATIPTETWVDKNGTMVNIQLLNCRNPEDENGNSNAFQQMEQARFFARASQMTPLSTTSPEEIERRRAAHRTKLASRRGIWRRMAEEQQKLAQQQAAGLARQNEVFDKLADVLAQMVPGAGKKRGE